MAGAVATGPTAVSAEQATPPSYVACIEMAAVNPTKALAAAERWSAEGGGDQASRCSALALVEMGRYGEAADRFDALARIQPGSPSAQAAYLAQAAHARLLAGETGAALADLDRAVAIRPDDPTLLVDRAQIHAADGRWPQAVDDLDRAITLEPANADAHVFRASANRRMGRLPDAMVDLDQALALAPDHPEALMERGMVKALTGDLDGARADWEAVVATAPGTPAAEIASENLARLDTAEE